ncbi:MAG TPA: ABC transporter permease [Silvibacterium sp.]|nr:ABC transporter permease [Silvibacterium sp.]
MHLLHRLFTRRRRYDDLSVSIQEHIEERVDELMEEGVPRKEAEQAARRAFGNTTLTEERSREVWQWAALESLLTDLKLTCRRIRRSPGFTATVLLTLAVGIGANTAVFSVINRVLLEPLPYPDSNQLISLWLNAPGAGGLGNFSRGLQLSPSMYLTFSEHNQTFQSIGIWTSGTANVTGLARPEQVRTSVISDGVLQTLAVSPRLGRWFSGADQDPRGGKTVMLSYGYWQRQLGGERNVIGRNIQIDSEPREIVGVMPRGFRMMDHDFDLLIPMAVDRVHQKLAPFGYQGIGRLKPGISLAQADADITRLIPVWMDSWSNGPGTNPHYYRIWRITPNFHPLKQQVIGNVSSVLWVVMATVGLVLLIACTNIANLLLVRAESRQHELSIRAALGAGRRRIARELLLESLVLGLVGGAVAVAVAWAGLRLLVAAGPANLPRLSEISLDAHSLIFALLLSAFSALFFGSIPVWKYARSGVLLSMNGTSRTATAGGARRRSRNLLVIAQTAMAFVLLISAVLMIRTFAALRDVRPGFSDPADIQTMGISIPDSLIPNPLMVTRTQNNIADQIAAIPGVTAVGFARSVPMEDNDPNWDELRVEGKQYPADEPPLRLFNYVSPGYFRAMGTHIVAGRDFTWADIYGLRPELIVSENFARESWGSAAAAIGKRVRQFSSMPWQEVIGVTEDVRVHGVDENAPAIIYWPAMLNDPYTQKPTIDAPNSAAFAIRSTRAGNQEFISRVQRAVWSVNPDLPVAAVHTMQDIYDRSLARTSFTLVMLAIAGSMALALSIIGIYGVISYSVSQRRREIGIRLALGAQRNALNWMFVRSALTMAAAGIAIGILAAGLLTQLMRSLLFGISPLDPFTYFMVLLVLIVAALLASYLPARRAAAVDPVETLRAE